MASQAAMFAETIAGMKKAIKRKAYDSDSDGSIKKLTNRGSKLRKRARFVHKGQLAPPSGTQVYKRRIEHAGFQRDIISLNPPLVDEDGYEVDSEDDDERAQSAMVAAAEFNPYSEVRIEHLLAPLTAASDLPEHPTLSKPFLSKTLTELTRHAGEMVQKEKASLWRIKHLLTRLSGDHMWIPCESVETDNDIALFGDVLDRQREHKPGKVITRDEADHVSTETLISEDVGKATEPMAGGCENLVVATGDMEMEAIGEASIGDIAMVCPVKETMTKGYETSKIEPVGIAKFEDPEVIQTSSRESETIVRKNPRVAEGSSEAAGGPTEPAQLPEDIIRNEMQLEGPNNGPDGDAADDHDSPAPHRMRTRAQAQAASDNVATSRTRSISPNSSTESFVHPFFLAPLASQPDRDFGLPQQEAEETRRLLQLYIQKQEEICRGAQRVYEGLLKANRYRHQVMKWAKAEAHLREMSDGEDWYDKEEWGLDEDLKKGQDEEEEDAATTAKKTRTRRQ